MWKGRETPQNLAIYERCGAETLQNLRVLSDYWQNPLFSGVGQLGQSHLFRTYAAVRPLGFKGIHGSSAASLKNRLGAVSWQIKFFLQSTPPTAAHSNNTQKLK
jgi:hypothetical protein